MKKKEPKLTFERFWLELTEAERFGNIAVRVTVENTLEKWKDEWAKLALITDCLICRATFVNARNKPDLTAIYLLLIRQIWDWAKGNLLKEAFRDFCAFNPRNQAYTMYSEDTPDILNFMQRFR